MVRIGVAGIPLVPLTFLHYLMLGLQVRLRVLVRVRVRGSPGQVRSILMGVQNRGASS